MNFESDWKEVVDQRSLDELLRLARGFRDCAIPSATWEGAELVEKGLGLRHYGPLILGVSYQSDDVRPLELSFQEVESFGYNCDLELGNSILFEPGGIIARIVEWEVRARSLAYRVVSAGGAIYSIEAVRDELAKWSGSVATLWNYSVSHSVLTIRLVRPGAQGNLHVECLGILSFSGPVNASGANFVIEETTRPHGRGSGQLPALHLKDLGALGISVYCDDIVLERNVDPVYPNKGPALF